MPSVYVSSSIFTKVMGRPSIVVEATAPMSCSARGSGDAGPAPRQTFTVGTSWRTLLQAQRSSGKLRNEPFWKVMVRSGDGGKPFIQPSASGSVSVAVAGCWLGAVAAGMKAGSGGDDVVGVSWDSAVYIPRLRRGAVQ